jgi:ferredoxin
LLEALEQMAGRAGAILGQEGMGDAYTDEITVSTRPSSQLDCRRFGKVSIDIDACSGCGLCVMFCPTGALAHEKYDKPADPARKYLDFNANMCVQCGLCKDVCMRNCMEVSSVVNVASLMDFEPALLEIKNAESGKKLFQRDFL